MRISLFDTINETIVTRALEDALDELGHDVVATGPVWMGHRPVRAPADRARLDAAVETVIAARCDALLNMRASSLTRAQVERLRRAGIVTAVWLPDDPVLYASAYEDIVDAYDIVLHCGPASVLSFYADKGHRPGINFPFWIDPDRWPLRWKPSGVRKELVFLGNLHGPAKQGRYRLLSAAAPEISIYGKCPEDPSGVHRGELWGTDILQSVLPCFRLGINIPQSFSDYSGTRYDFPGLAGLGKFFLPSRVIQYAALGLPVVTIGGNPAGDLFPHMLTARDALAALGIARELGRSPEAAESLSARARSFVLDHYSGRARAAFLVALFEGRVEPAALDIDGRERIYLEFSGRSGNGGQ